LKSSRNEKEEITTSTKGIQRIIRNYLKTYIQIIGKSRRNGKISKHISLSKIETIGYISPKQIYNKQ
jgi:hypothetical protein